MANRLRPVKTALLVAAIFEGAAERWLTVKEVHKSYVENVGCVTPQSLARYVSMLEEVGFIECRRNGGKTARRFYRWVGYPIPIRSIT